MESGSGLIQPSLPFASLDLFIEDSARKQGIEPAFHQCQICFTLHERADLDGPLDQESNRKTGYPAVQFSEPRIADHYGKIRPILLCRSLCLQFAVIHGIRQNLEAVCPGQATNTSHLFGIKTSLDVLGKSWWRRRESNPRPKSLSARSVHALPGSFWFRPRHSERTRCDGS